MVKYLINKFTSRSRLLAIAFVLMLAVPALLISLPSANAVDVESYLFITATPNPVGVDQVVSIMWWLAIPPPGASGPAGPRWENLMLKIESPDGVVETRGPLTSDANGGAYISYVPKSTGTYKFSATFPGQWINTTTYERWYKPATSQVLEVVVQQDQITSKPETELPSGYWSRPIYGENREWYQIGGNWLMGKYDKDAVAYEGSGNWNPYSKVPNTGHIMWTKELQLGGVVGGDFGYGMSYYGGLNYEPKFRPPIIINGILYYNTADPPRYGFQAVDLRTGKTLWYQNYTYELSFGQIFDYESPNQHGAIAYLWARVGSTWHMHDAFTGNYILSISNVPSGYITMGPVGEVLVYSVNTAGNTTSLWNSTRAIHPPGEQVWYWRPDNYRGQTINGTRGIQWTTTIPKVDGAGNSIQWFDKKAGVFVTSATQQLPNEASPTFVHVGFNATTGEMIWTQNRTQIGAMSYPVYIMPYEGIYVLPFRETKQWIAWDIKTGLELWRTDPIADDWGMYEVGGGFANGIFFSAGWAGAVHAYNSTTGKFLWRFYSGDAGLDTPYGSWAFYGASIIADDKIIIAHNEHSPNVPLWRGMKLWVIDAKTGEGIWNISGAYQAGRNAMGALADGYIVTHNAMDNRIYCFGKGPSQTTVTASPKIQTAGSSILIEGTVTDQSEGAKGTPAIADEYMTPWMEYLYMQQPMPTNAKGVQVELTATDANGKVINIGTATAEMSGVFGLKWTPPAAGTYKITATFKGSESYGSSYAETFIGVDEAPASPSTTSPAVTTTPTTEPTQTSTVVPTSTLTASPSPIIDNPGSSSTETLLIAAAAAVVIIAVIAAALVLRKHK